MRSSIALSLATSTLTFLAIGCAAKTLRFTAISTKPVEVLYRSGGEVEGRHCVPFFMVPLGTTQQFDAAVRDAIGNKGNALRNARFHVSTRPFQSCSTVVGEVVMIEPGE